MSESIAKVKAPSEPLFSKKNRKLITDPLTDNNPVTVQVLGICSALAITVKIDTSLVMGLSVIFVTAIGNFVISALRNIMPPRIRIIVQLVVAAALVIIVNEILKAFLPDISEQLSVFVGLIITNCIIMGRFEAFAMANKPWPSFLDGIGNGLGYAGLLLIVGFFRELFGSGSLLGFKIFGSAIPGEEWGLYTMGYANNNLVILPPMALIIVGIIIWIQRSRNKNLQEEI
ncbi:MAG: NADH:ubiquinone reductase (Na(+)-transporting) subunit D [Flavobacteriales bacterium]|nr:NADH:ubiquinone reductase (Na(+)-transporting) subunit D [Flavobacteriales bacterium]